MADSMTAAWLAASWESALLLGIGLCAVALGWTRPRTTVALGQLRPWRDAALALAGSLVFAVLTWMLTAGAQPDPLLVFLVFWLGVAALSDWRVGLLPDSWTAFGAAVVLAWTLLTEGSASLVVAVGWGGAVALALFALRALGQLWRGKPGVGWGDVKLGFVLGVAFGSAAFWITYGAFLALGSVIAFRETICILTPTSARNNASPPHTQPLGPGFYAATLTYASLAQTGYLTRIAEAIQFGLV